MSDQKSLDIGVPNPSSKTDTVVDKDTGIEPANRNCFVICPIGEDGSETRIRSDKVFRHLIEPVCDLTDLSPIRADKIEEPGIITNQIIKRLLEDSVVVADLSSGNANVFYELAIRHCARLPVVQIIGKGEMPPFDTASARTISFDLTDPDDLERAKEQLEKQVTAILNPSAPIENPVSLATKSVFWSLSNDPEKNVAAEIIDAVNAMGENVSDSLDDMSFDVSNIESSVGYNLESQVDDLTARVEDITFEELDNKIDRLKEAIDEIAESVRDLAEGQP